MSHGTQLRRRITELNRFPDTGQRYGHTIGKAHKLCLQLELGHDARGGFMLRTLDRSDTDFAVSIGRISARFSA